MTTQKTPPRPVLPDDRKLLNARDRLLAALQAAPRLSRQEAERLNAVVQESREASRADNA